MQLPSILVDLIPLLPFVAAAAWYWFVARVPFDKLAPAGQVLDVLRWQPVAVQAKYLNRCAMTRRQWYSLRVRHIDWVKRELGMHDFNEAALLDPASVTGATGISIRRRR